MACVYILNQLAKEAKSGAPELLAILKDKDREEFVRADCARTLARIGADGKGVVEVLLAAVKDRSQDVREAAASALLKIDPDAAKKAGVKPRDPKKVKD